MNRDVKNLEMRKVQRNDFESLTDLYSEVYGVNFNKSYWDWKYFQNPSGEHIMYVALEGEKVVGETGTIAVKIKYGDDSFPSSQTCDITVLPEYQKGGTFLKLYKLTNDENIIQNNLICYGFSVPTTLKISTKLMRFRPVCRVYRWVLLLNPTPYIAKKLKISSVSKILGYLGKIFIKLYSKRNYISSKDRVSEISRFDERFDQFWEERKRDYGIMVIRDSAYLNWRYINNPVKRYKIFSYELDNKIKGFIVLTTVIEELRRGIIMDIMVDPEERDAVDYLLSAAIDFFWNEKADVITIWVPEHIPLAKLIERWGFVKRETQHNLIVRLIQKDEKRVIPEYIMNPGNWYFTLGDSDYY